MKLKFPTYKQTATAHKAADKRCGREWVCMCGACRMIRKQPKISIRGNRFDHWTGYIGGKVAITFANTPEQSAKLIATKWKESLERDIR